MTLNETLRNDICLLFHEMIHTNVTVKKQTNLESEGKVIHSKNKLFGRVYTFPSLTLSHNMQNYTIKHQLYFLDLEKHQFMNNMRLHSQV